MGDICPPFLAAQLPWLPSGPVMRSWVHISGHCSGGLHAGLFQGFSSQATQGNRNPDFCQCPSVWDGVLHAHLPGDKLLGHRQSYVGQGSGEGCMEPHDGCVTGVRGLRAAAPGARCEELMFSPALPDTFPLLLCSPDWPAMGVGGSCTDKKGGIG